MKKLVRINQDKIYDSFEEPIKKIKYLLDKNIDRIINVDNMTDDHIYNY